MLIDARTQLSPRSPKEAAMTVRLTIQSFDNALHAEKSYPLLAKLRRLVNGRVAAAISCHAYRAAQRP
jgi:hypothetical protein